MICNRLAIELGPIYTVERKKLHHFISAITLPKLTVGALGGSWLGRTDGQKAPVFRRRKSGNMYAYIQGGSEKSKLLYCVNSLLFLSHPVYWLKYCVGRASL